MCAQDADQFLKHRIPIRLVRCPREAHFIQPTNLFRGEFVALPRGALALVQMEIPVIGPQGELAGWRPVTRFVLNQDTGGAIRGPQRADYYFGTGDEAGALAGYMNRQGRLYFLVRKQR